MDLDELRRSYEESALGRDDLAACPIQQFEDWFRKAQDTPAPAWFEANAMTLATACSQRVSSRIVLLKRFDEQGFVFFTNYDSDKGRQLQENPQASLTFYWPHVERQVRIEGTVAKTASATSDHYFHARPIGSQLGAVASPQSKEIASRAEVVDRTMELATEFGDATVPRPEYWGGYCLAPDRIEFWQGRPSRLHDRFVYTKRGDATEWAITRLAP